MGAENIVKQRDCCPADAAEHRRTEHADTKCRDRKDRSQSEERDERMAANEAERAGDLAQNEEQRGRQCARHCQTVDAEPERMNACLRVGHKQLLFPAAPDTI